MTGNTGNTENTANTENLQSPEGAGNAASAAAASAAGPVFDLSRFRDLVPAGSARYAAGAPFPHIVLDDMLLAKPEILESFPARDWPYWQPLGDTYQVEKYTCNDIGLIPEPYKSLIHELSAPAFLRLLEKLTGITKLIPDPYLAGGGLHLSGPGGILAPHTDFHIYDQLGLYRRVNVLVYLNEDWDESYGGCLELGEPGKVTATVVPRWGRMMVFTTDDKSIHGFPKPIAEGRWRRSVALYYYTAEEAATFSGDSTTHWREHGTQTGVVRKARFAAFKVLLQASRGFSLLAHLANPNQGGGWWKTRKERLAQDKARGL
jgi:hypothetical protein